MRRMFFGLSFIAALIAITLPAQPAKSAAVPVKYRMIPLETPGNPDSLYGIKIGDKLITMNGIGPNGKYGALYSFLGGPWRPLKGAPDYFWSRGISANGKIVGAADGRAYIWSANTVRPLTALNRAYDEVRPTGISTNGLYVTGTVNEHSSGRRIGSFRYSVPTDSYELRTDGEAEAINNTGLTTGLSVKPYVNFWIFRWAAGDSFEKYEDGYGTAINNRGTIVGQWREPNRYVGCAFRQTAGGEIEKIAPDYRLSEALDVNDREQVVGQLSYVHGRGFLWTPEQGLADLNDLLVNLNAGEMREATGINRQGWIVGFANRQLSDGTSRRSPVMLKPIGRFPAPVEE